MLSQLQACVSLFKSRLSQRIVVWVFGSIVAIEIVILIPSYYRRERELLRQLETVSSEVLASTAPMMQEGATAREWLDRMVTILNRESAIAGIALYQDDGSLIGNFGEAPMLPISDLTQMNFGQTYRSRDGDRYDVAWPTQDLSGEYILVVRHNSSMIQGELYAYVGRIAILSLIIASGATLVTMIVLGMTAITPILRLRDDLLTAGKAIAGDGPEPDFCHYSLQRQDELGEVVRAFQNMFGRINQEIRNRNRAEAALRQEQEKSERLLLNILPHPIAEQLKQGQKVMAHRFDAVTILFADIVDFTSLSARISATELVNFLNDIFSAFDRLAERYSLEKIKTIGDAYMVVGGLPVPRADHAAAIAAMALDMQVAIAQFQDDRGQPFRLRIGINTGPIVSGVIGIKKFSYDLWGDAVNIASRMESQGIPGKIQVTEATYSCLQDQYQFEKRGTLEVKGRGSLTTYFLTDFLTDEKSVCLESPND